MNNIATKFSSSGDATYFNENSRNKKRVYLGIVGIFSNSSFIIPGVAEKNMRMRFYLEGPKPRGIIFKIQHYF